MWGSNGIRRIVRVTQMLKRWRKKATSSSSKNKICSVPSDVPPGHVAVIVGPASRRYVVRTAHLNHPMFRNLLRIAEEEYGFDNNDGPICIPSDESSFEDVLRVVTQSKDLPRRCRVSESIPLLRSEKSLC